MDNHNILGRQGETIAAEYLIKKGYVVRETNWKSGKLELDIVAQKDVTLIIVEVKTRKSDFFGNPEDAVTQSKIKKILRATDAYIRIYNIPFEVRFDIISIIEGYENDFKIEHIEDAFYPPLS